MTTDHMVNDKKHKSYINDIKRALVNQPGLNIVYGIKGPLEIAGNYILFDDKLVAQDNWDIRIVLPKNYPYGFPIVYETSNKIEPTEEFHVNKNGSLCFDLEINIEYKSSLGLKIESFFDTYMIPFFSWQLLKRLGYENELKFWGHGHDGHRQFITEVFKTSDKGKVHFIFNHFQNNKKIGRNEQCFCGSNLKFKKCHEGVFVTLEKYKIAIIEEYISTLI